MGRGAPRGPETRPLVEVRGYIRLTPSLANKGMWYYRLQLACGHEVERLYGMWTPKRVRCGLCGPRLSKSEGGKK